MVTLYSSDGFQFLICFIFLIIWHAFIAIKYQISYTLKVPKLRVLDHV